MIPPTRGSRLNDLVKDHEGVAEIDTDTEDDFIEDAGNDISHGQRDAVGHLTSLDDEALFDVFKRIVCTFLQVAYSLFFVFKSISLNIDCL